MGDLVTVAFVVGQLAGFVPHALRTFVVVGVAACAPLAFLGPAVHIAAFAERPVGVQIQRVDVRHFGQIDRYRYLGQTLLLAVLHYHGVKFLLGWCEADILCK